MNKEANGMAYFPMFVNLENKKVIVLGGGKPALRKINSLVKFGCRIAVVAPRICDEIKLVPGIAVHEANMSLDTLDSADLVIAATNRDDINVKIGKYCREHGIEVNVEGNKNVSTFLFPGIVTRDELVIGVTTGGNSGSVAKEVRNMIERIIPDGYGQLAKKMSAYSNLASVNIKNAKYREQALDEIVKMAVNNKCEIDDRKAGKIIDKYAKM